MNQTSNYSQFYRVVLGKLVARTAIHIGSGQDNKVTDSLCRRNIEGKYIIPGTAIGGALRSIATRIAPRLGSRPCQALWTEQQLKKQKESSCLCWTCNLFGDINPGVGDGKTPDGEASHLFIAHSTIENSSPVIRDGVGIDRISKTSANASSAKFDLEVLPKGVETQLRIELAHNATQQDEILLAATLAEWQEGRCWLGGRVARGLGAFDLTGLKLIKRDLSTTKAIVSFLKADDAWEEADNTKHLESGFTENTNWLTEQLSEKSFCEVNVYSKDFSDTQEFIAQSFMKIEFKLAMTSAFLVNDTVASAWTGFDSFPLLNNSFFDPSQCKPLLPGASLRGVIRSQAEKIARTLTTLDAVKNTDSKKYFLEHCPACNPLEYGASEVLASCDTLLKNKVSSDKELEDNQLCLACRLFGSSRLGSRLIIEDAEADENLVKKIYDFVAIDRFTGGARDGAKFDAVTAIKPTFTIRVHLENPKKWELGWLVLTLRDLKDGLVPIGFGAAKGFGQVRVDNYKFTHGFISESDFLGDIKQFPKMQKNDSGIYKTFTCSYGNKTDENFSKLATLWVKEFNEKCKTFNRDENIKLTKDSYFDESSDMTKLYEVEAYKCLLP